VAPRYDFTLRELEAEFLQWSPELWPDGGGHRRITIQKDQPAGANGLSLLCPHCLEANHGDRVGVHTIHCWDPSVPLQDGLVGPGRWELLGTSLDDLTLRASSSSVHVQGGCGAHFYVRNGRVFAT
jgi:hypothetical protein